MGPTSSALGRNNSNKNRQLYAQTGLVTIALCLQDRRRSRKAIDRERQRLPSSHTWPHATPAHCIRGQRTRR